MAFNSISTLKKNRVYAPMIVALAILFFIFLARPSFSAYNEAKMQLMTAETTLAEKQSTLEKLEKNAQLIADSNSDLAKKVQKIAQPFNTSDIIETVLINPHTTFTAASTALKPLVNVTNVAIDKGTKQPNGLNYGTVNMTVTSSSVTNIATFLDYLTGQTKYAFYLNDITLPVTTGMPISHDIEEYSVSVALGLYYYP